MHTRDKNKKDALVISIHTWAESERSAHCVFMHNKKCLLYTHINRSQKQVPTIHTHLNSDSQRSMHLRHPGRDEVRNSVHHPLAK